MQQRVFFLIVLLSPIALGGSATVTAQSASGGSYLMQRQVIAGGGVRASGGEFVLTGTVAQSAVGASAAGTFWLSSGFYGPNAGASDLIFHNGFDN